MNIKQLKTLIGKKPNDNIILTNTDSIALDDKTTNKNVFVIGSAGTGKTRSYAIPNIMQMNSSYVVSDSYGLILTKVGKLLVEKGNYKIKSFDLCDYKRSMHYNPFAYIHSDKDIFTLINVIMNNTQCTSSETNDFLIDMERLVYTAYIGFICSECPKCEQNFGTLIKMLEASEVNEEFEDFKNPIDILFEELEQKNPNHFAVKQYKKYKQLATCKIIKSVFMSCTTRLAILKDKDLQELMSYDELELETLRGGAKDNEQKTALFIAFPTSWCNMTLITAMLYTQLFAILNDKANGVFQGGLPIPVYFILDDFPQIGKIPNFDKIIATLKSRNIWVSIIIQSIPKIKRIYKDDYKEILKYCDNMLYFGSVNNETQALVREYLGIKEWVDLRPMICLVARKKTYSFSDPYNIAKHKFYRYISDNDKSNGFSIEKYIEEGH